MIIVEDIIDTVRPPSPPSLPSSLFYSGIQSTGTVDVSGCNPDGLKDRNVIIVEDIIDTVRVSSLPPFLLPLDAADQAHQVLPSPPSSLPPSLPPSFPQGNTLRKLVPLLHSHHPASLRILALFQKRLLSSQGGREGGKEGEAIPNLGGVGFSLPDKVRREGGREGGSDVCLREPSSGERNE